MDPTGKDSYLMWLSDVEAWYNSLSETEQEGVQRIVVKAKARTEFVTCHFVGSAEPLIIRNEVGG